jgi:hypothetical protein
MRDVLLLTITVNALSLTLGWAFEGVEVAVTITSLESVARSIPSAVAVADLVEVGIAVDALGLAGDKGVAVAVVVAALESVGRTVSRGVAIADLVVVAVVIEAELSLTGD